jgi:hyperosmotically inducible protein
MNNTYSKIVWAIFIVALVPLTACNKAPVADLLALQSGSNAANVVDTDVTINVKAAFANDPALKAFDIDVMTRKGDVRLSGVVDTQSQINAAIKLAQNVDGAHAVHDRLTIKM